MSTLDMGIVGNGTIAGLVSAEGDYQWLCLPRFDGEPVFNQLLGGSGTFGGLVTMNASTTLAPGNSPGTMTFNDGLTLNGVTSIDFELGNISDLILVTGGMLTGPDSGLVTLNLFDSGGFAPGSYTLIDFTGAGLSDFDISDFTLGQQIDGYEYSLDFVGSTLQLTSIPEPGTSLFLTLAALAATFHRPRRIR